MQEQVCVDVEVQARVMEGPGEKNDNQPIQVDISDVVTPAEVIVKTRQPVPEVKIPQLIPVRVRCDGFPLKDYELTGCNNELIEKDAKCVHGV